VGAYAKSNSGEELTLKNHTQTIVALAAAALLAAVSLVASADDVKAGGPSNKAPRAVNDSPVKSEGASSKSGRVPSINGGEAKSGGVKRQSSTAKDGPGTADGRSAEAGPVAEGDSPRVKTSKAKE
jgi:hypothetical protein